MNNKLAAMPKYEAYKDSGVDWLGRIPEHWTVERIKSIGNIVNGATPSSGVSHYWDGDLVWAAPTDINNIKYLYNSARKLTKRGYESCGTALAPAGSVVLTCRAPIGKVVMAGVELCTNQGCKTIVLKEGIENKFIYYALSITADKLNSLGTGTTFLELSSGALKNFRFPLPSFFEQRSIAEVLDIKTSQIDEAISIKEKQIALLKERKQIIIQKAVTQGLNPDVPMKDSCVDWIGQIPEHWAIKRAKYLFNEVNERSSTGEEELLSVSHMTGVSPRSDKTNVYMFMAEDYTGSKLCHKNDLVMNIMWAWMGALGVSNQTGIISPSYGVYRQKKESTFNPVYLEYLLKTTKYIEYYNKVSTGLHSSRLRFYGHMFFAMKLGFPDFDEQRSIVHYLEEQTAKIDQAVAVQNSQIEKLKEYKATLINSAVTGKIKVA